jgi:hypothetical protein
MADEKRSPPFPMSADFADPHARQQGFLLSELDNTQPFAADITRAAILKAHNTNNVVCSSPEDFVLGPQDVIRTPGQVLPYCFDIAGKRSIYVSGLDPAAARRAPFYYLYARRQATSVTFVPWEAGSILPSTDTVKPIFVFSPGRCGSTLLNRIFFEAGVPAVSEPDFFTQFTAGILFDAKPELYAGTVKTALINLTRDLVHGLSRENLLVIKLRSEVCFVVKLLLGIPQERPKTIFMFRALEPWARSTLRMFEYSPQQLLSKYTLALKCLMVMRRMSDCHVVYYESLLADPVRECAALGGFLGKPISPEAATRAMAEDAQEGTPVARSRRIDPPELDAKIAEIVRLWNAPNLAGLREQVPPMN